MSALPAEPQRSCYSTSFSADLPVLVALLREPDDSTTDGGASAMFAHFKPIFHMMPAVPGLSLEVTVNS